MARGSDKLVSAQIEPVSSRCPGDNFNNSRGAACPAGSPLAQPQGLQPAGLGAGAAVGRAGHRHMPGSPPARNLERPAMRDGRPGTAGGRTHPRHPRCQTEGPLEGGSPRLPALHLRSLDDVVEIGRHGFSTVSLRLVSLGRRGRDAQVASVSPAPPITCSEILRRGCCAELLLTSLPALSIVLQPSPGACWK